ncbi:acyl carrier protein 2, mitochondrial-like isoform X1 [Phragmites australis]|uniref:acyl carrier protein 2, mitochondrial-like isoform X1 n=1 Tax=Phragmites australis TaxID=29695 RepID=UPI002D77573C|nr:acyl carrier protein 2, mitochondrial-like isoform X1 [Phragmites australis]
MAAAAARSLLLRHLRLAAAPSAASVRPAAALQGAMWGRRSMSSEEAKGSFLDKSEVTDRIIKVVRNFQKIDDPSKLLIEGQGGTNGTCIIGYANSERHCAALPKILDKHDSSEIGALCTITAGNQQGSVSTENRS